MNVRFLGTKYGGRCIDLDSLPNTATVLDLGVGMDVSFAMDLLRFKPNVELVLVDPDWRSLLYARQAGLCDYDFILAAVSVSGGSKQFYNPGNKSGSLCAENSNTRNVKPTWTNCVPLSDLIKVYRPELVKLDIEGEEYAVYRDCLGVRQVCIEFHHRIMSKKTPQDTQDAIDFFKSNGYLVLPQDEQSDDYTFLRRLEARST